MKAKDIIKQDITEYAQKEKHTSVNSAIEALCSMVPPDMLNACENSELIMAWTVLQILNNTHLKYHNSKELGEFVYDTRMFKIFELDDGPNYIRRLSYLDSNLSRLIIPDGCISLRYTFYNSILCDEFVLSPEVCTSGIIDMTCMFKDSTLHTGFQLTENFDVSNVTSMYGMFMGCKLPQNFRLPSTFKNLQNVDTRRMFEGAVIGNKKLDFGPEDEIIKSILQ